MLICCANKSKEQHALLSKGLIPLMSVQENPGLVHHKKRVNLVIFICAGHSPKADDKQIFGNSVFFDILDGASLTDL